MTRIRIVVCPPGEAPLAIRNAWVGLELPLPSGLRSRPRRWLGFGVLSGPRGWWQELIRFLLGRAEQHTGYAVNALEAVNILATKDPAAAAWWRENCAHLLNGRRFFVFAADACMECPEVPQPPGVTSS